MTRNVKLEKWLLIAIILISGTLFMAARAAAIGIDVIDRYGAWFVEPEILGGIGLALLEAVALHYVAGAWYRLERGQLEWRILGGIMVALLMMIPITSTPAVVAKQYDVSIVEALRWSHITANHLSWIWTLTLTSVPSVMAFSIGVAGSIYQSIGEKQDPRTDQQKILDAMLDVGTLDPFVLSEHSGVVISRIDETIGKFQDLFRLKGRP